jgi:hypothetical protein
MKRTPSLPTPLIKFSARWEWLSNTLQLVAEFLLFGNAAEADPEASCSGGLRPWMPLR